MNNESSNSFPFVTEKLAAIIPDIPIVSIAGATLSKITTTTTSTSTTPTPIPTPTVNKPANQDDNKPKSSKSMSTAAAKAGGAASSAVQAVSTNSSANVNTNDNDKKDTSQTDTQSEVKTKESESWEEESSLNNIDEVRLKDLLEEAYSYKNPRDKENKSKTFLHLLKKAENEKEDQKFSFREMKYTRFQRNSSSTSSSANNQKQGGSLQDIDCAWRNEVGLDGDYSFGSVSARNRRHNHNSRQKKYSLVSSRQREGGSLPSNVNVTNYSHFYSTFDTPKSLGLADRPTSSYTPYTQPPSRRNTKGAAGSANAASATRESDKTDIICSGTTSAPNDNDSSTDAKLVMSGIRSLNDYIVEMEDGAVLDVHQEQHILEGRPERNEGRPFYERLDHMDELRIPRAIVGSRVEPKPTRMISLVDDNLHFGNLERGAVAASNVGANAATIEYLDLDENYKSCQSVLDGASKLDRYKGTHREENEEETELLNNQTFGITSMYSTTKTITRQFDENGNTYNEFCHLTGGSVTPAIGLSTAGSFVSTNPGILGSGGSQAQAKTKASKRKKDNMMTVDVKSVAGYRGGDPIEDLVKYIENTDDKQNNKNKKERKKDKHKMKKSNSLEELRSCAKMEVDDLKRTAATTETTNVLSRNKGGKQGKNNSASAADINKNFESVKEQVTSAVAGGGNDARPIPVIVTTGPTPIRKGERRSWGTEELQYLGDSSIGANEEKMKEKKGTKNKEKERDKDKEKEKETDKEAKEYKEKTAERNEHKDNKEKTAEKNEKNANIATEKHEKEGGGKHERSERRKKSDVGNSPQTTANSNNDNNNTAATAMIDVGILAMGSVLTETAEFHVVTKKKKTKKQRSAAEDAGNNSNNSVGGSNRTHNFINSMSQKSASAGEAKAAYGQQHQHLRHKHYNERMTAHDRGDYVTGGNYHQQQQQHNQQLLQHPSSAQSETGNNKSRRKSASSMPPSEKSDSSDLDSVHSLPVESRTKNKQRHKNITATAEGKITTSNVSTGNKNTTAPVSYADITRTNKELAAAAAAAIINNGMDKWPTVEVANSNNSNNISLNTEPQTPVHVADEVPTANQNNSPHITNNATTTTTSTKTKTRKVKPDFPELVSSANVTVVAAVVDCAASAVKAKTISYSQSLSAVPRTIAVTVVAGNDAALATAGPAAVAVSNVVVNDIRPERRHGATETAAKASISIQRHQQAPQSQHQQVHTQSQLHQQHNQQQQQQMLQKSKSVDTETYNYNSSNMDQQYPALEKTVKRHSANNMTASTAATLPNMVVVMPTPTASTATQFNFAAAAKRQMQPYTQMNIMNDISNRAATTTSIMATTIAAAAPVVCPATPPLSVLTNIANGQAKKPKDKMTNPPCAVAVEQSNNQTVAAKTKKDKQQQQASVVLVPTIAATSEPCPAQKSSTATQTQTGNPTGKVRNNINVALIPTATAAAAKSDCHKTQKAVFVSASAATANQYLRNAAPPAAATGSGCNSNTPAVIIPYESDGAFITFGDFNTNDFILFDGTDEEVMPNNEYITYNNVEQQENFVVPNDILPPQSSFKMQNKTTTKATANIHSSASASTATTTPSATVSTPNTTFFNDSGASSDANVCCNSSLTQQAEDVILVTGPVNAASSPNSSFADVQAQSNRSSDSGIYAAHKTTSGSTCKIIVPADAQQPTAVPDAGVNKLNTFLKTQTAGYIADPVAPAANCMPTQQLETCNDIETAMLAAARAKQHQEPPPPPHHYTQHVAYQQTQAQPQQLQQHPLHQQLQQQQFVYHQHQHQLHYPPLPQQQQQYYNHQQQQLQQVHIPNSQSLSNSSSFSSSTVSVDSIIKYPPSQDQPFSFLDNTASPPRNDGSHAPHALHPTHFDPSGCEEVYTPPPSRSHSPASRSQSSEDRDMAFLGDSVETASSLPIIFQVTRKEYALHYLPPTVSTIAIQQTDIIADFIGSAWNEVANHKQTLFYREY